MRLNAAHWNSGQEVVVDICACCPFENLHHQKTLQLFKVIFLIQSHLPFSTASANSLDDAHQTKTVALSAYICIINSSGIVDYCLRKIVRIS